MGNKNIVIPLELYDNFDLIEKLYRENHPEMTEVYISKRKLVYELQLYYLKGTKYERLIKTRSGNI